MYDLITVEVASFVEFAAMNSSVACHLTFICIPGEGPATLFSFITHFSAQPWI
jgi:hypothetical protein